MKHLAIISGLCALIILIETSCKKQTVNMPLTTRQVQYVLYTTSNFSNDDDSIFFKISITKPGSQILFDSLLAPMRIKDIPNRANKLVINKVVPGNDPSQLRVGFYYTIKNVGYSSYTEPFNEGEVFTVVDYNFQ